MVQRPREPGFTALRNPLVIEPEPQDPAILEQRVRAHRGDILFHKHWFDVFTNPNVLPVVDVLAPAQSPLTKPVSPDSCQPSSAPRVSQLFHMRLPAGTSQV